MEKLQSVLNSISNFVWGPVMLAFLVGTGIFLTIRLDFLPWRNLGRSLKTLFSKESRRTDNGEGDISPFSALMTALAATVGTGNIVGVATAMAAGGPGALVWMWISAAFGISTKYAECTLALKYRTVNEKGEMCGGPMYTLKNGLKNKKLGGFLAVMFAVFTVIASFGIGNFTQANSIASAVNSTFFVSPKLVGVILVVLIILIVLGGIKSISKVSTFLVPAMAVFYIVSGLVVVAINYKNLPEGISQIFTLAFTPRAAAGGVAGTVLSSMRYGIARGVFSNEAGLGSAAISAASATSDHHVRQGYINMCGTFIDTIVVCTITGLAIASSGVLGKTDAQGAQLTIVAFETALGKAGGIFVTIGIILFAFSTILGWEYTGEKALEFIFKKPVFSYIYRIVFALLTYVGATVSLDIVWSFSDIANGLMAVPNLISLLALSSVLAKDTKDFQKVLKKEKENEKLLKMK
ncbi:MAG: sodium:alanine symporter family protein [Eubacteriales bacterium]|nr:sodium:alanine symporter family protein [Eubacteriales bacterium]